MTTTPSPSLGGPSAAASEAFTTLRALQADGLLLKEFPRALALFGGLTDAELPRAGRLLGSVDTDELSRSHPGLPTVKVSITGHSTVSALVPALTAQFARHGLVALPQLADFDSYVFELSDPRSELYAYEPDLALCVLDAEVVLDELPSPWTVRDLEDVLGAKAEMIERIVARFEDTARGTLVLNTLPLPHTLLAQLVDLRSRARAGAAWREANARLLRLAEAHPQLVVLDLDAVTAAEREVNTSADPRMSRYAKVHLSPETLGGYAREVGHLARMVAGRGRKCLVLDLDNTVWGGILGDDGLDGIQVAESYVGEAFRAFQRVARQIASQGVLLAAVSKNDLDPVREVLRDHPDMTLREADFVRIVANWRPKHDNLRELASDLNIGVDSLVFVDDSPYERGLVRAELPEVAVVDIDDEPALHIERLLRDGWFTVRELTAEDRGRPGLYREELERRDFLSGFDSIEGYLRELDIQVRLYEAEERDVPRVSQITLRTNQFNMTGRRLQPDDVRALRTDPRALPLAIHASDRFGDNGTVGVVFLRFDGDTAVIDNFLLSCRVFSRGIEQACLSAVLRYAKRRGATAVTGTYARTAKNAKVADLYTRSGFEAVGDAPGEGPAVFRHQLGELPEAPGHVHLTEEFGDTGRFS
ncbi:HAD-IIIC family phosphatase [Streptomyces kanamyceticus]|uniref:HAD-IIIC family phosphatase n=1 Tax=Streptomyces kanamyceticus TaxID=1967 RepID=A0A5J6GRX4_STRKN|nr:HAD-IIIC family phosphatase [Streptomyces kanamyceticus]QEU95746.1 HAD-IIIC family phosphatase [Streptomyces kanamyceticus]